MIVVMIVMWTCHVDVVHTRFLQASYENVKDMHICVVTVVELLQCLTFTTFRTVHLKSSCEKQVSIAHRSHLTW